MSTTPQPWLEELIAWSTHEPTKDDLVAAKKDFFERTGEVFDDDRQLEMRMSTFLEHYVCDRVAPHLGMTPARARYLEALKTEPPERAAAWRSLTETMHGLFQVRRIKPGDVRLRGVFNGIDFDVYERRQLVGLEAGDVLECRLVPYAGALHFSIAWCFHPHEASRAILAQAAALQKAGSVDEAAFVAECAQRALKTERYRQIAVEKIYDFGGRRF